MCHLECGGNITESQICKEIRAKVALTEAQGAPPQQTSILRNLEENS